MGGWRTSLSRTGALEVPVIGVETGSWFYENSRRLRCRVLEHVGTWGQQAVREWYPEAQTILLVDPGLLTPVEQLPTSPQGGAYVTDRCPWVTCFWPRFQARGCFGFGDGCCSDFEGTVARHILRTDHVPG